MQSNSCKSPSQKESPTLSLKYKIFTKIEGNIDCFNDAIIFRSTECTAKFNLIYFGGDVQDYEDEMKKSSTCRSFTQWNLINTGSLLLKRFSSNLETCANIIIIRADYFHLKCFANYSNFLPSTDFGVPLGNASDLGTKLDFEDESSNSPIEDEVTNKARSWEHLLKLYQNSISNYNNSLNPDENKLDPSLPIIYCAFSKGCVVLNQLCKELSIIKNLNESSFSQEDQSSQLNDFLKQVKHLIWLDGGHSGTCDSWLTNEETIELIEKFNWACYVYVTPYQLKSRKFWAIEEYQKFIDILIKYKVKMKNIYYFQEKEDEDYDVNLHFELLKHFDTNLI